jgi:hypothetical protein
MQQMNGFSSTTFSSVPNSIRALAMMMAITAGGTLGITPALADDDKTDAPKVDHIEGDFNENIQEEVRVQPGQGGGSFTITNSWTENGNSYSVTNNNGNISVKVNGEKLPADRWRDKDGKLEILNKDGDVEATTDMPSMDNGGIKLRWGGQGRGWQEQERGNARRRLNEMMVPPVPAVPAVPSAPRPPVMLGINMSVVDEGVQVDRVIDDLPAHKAGVREGDIITKVGDSVVEDSGDIVAALRDRKPGEKLDIVVLRDGKQRALTADLVAYNAETIEVPGIPEIPGLIEVPMLNDLPLLGENITRNHNEMREQLDKLVEQLRAQAKDLSKDHNDAGKALEEARKALEDAADQLDQAREQLNQRRAQGNIWVAPGGRGAGNNQMFVLPDREGRLRIERWDGDGWRPEENRESADDIKELRDEMRKLREEMKELRQKNEQESKDKP